MENDKEKEQIENW